MTGMNRTLEDGQIVLIDGAYPLIHNIHGTVNDWPADAIEEARDAADARAKRAFLARIEGEWTLDVEQTRDRSVDTPIGEVTAPITVLMKEEGEFAVSAPGIDVGNGTMQLSIDVTGRIDAETIVHDDRLMFEAKIVDVDASNCSLTLAGISLPGVEEMIEGFLKYFHRPQRIEVIRADPDREEMRIVADATSQAEEMTQVLTRRAAWRTHVLNRPEFVSQKARHLCWAAALASILRTLKVANHDRNRVTTPLPTPDPFPEFTTDGIIAKVREHGIKYSKNWFNGDNLEGGRPATAPHNDNDRLLLKHDESDWNRICEWFLLPQIKAYPATEGKYAVDGATGLKLEDIKAQIDRDRYGLMAFADPAWITPTEPKPTWHVVVVFGYDMDNRKLLVLDPNSAIFAAKQIDPTIKYFMTWKAADTWDPKTQKWVEGSRRNQP